MSLYKDYFVPGELYFLKEIWAFDNVAKKKICGLENVCLMFIKYSHYTTEPYRNNGYYFLCGSSVFRTNIPKMNPKTLIFSIFEKVTI